MLRRRLGICVLAYFLGLSQTEPFPLQEQALKCDTKAPRLTWEMKLGIDTAVTRILTASGVPSASIAVVTNSTLDYARAYGAQRLDESPATNAMRYPIASVSKQFTAAALLLLVEDGRLSLDHTIDRYLPTLTSAETVTIRQLLGHTSGYRDFWPQDFPFEAMTRPTTPQSILQAWATAPLDFAPGSKHQYSNTGYTVAGLIAEIVAGEPLHAFEQHRLFSPLGMNVAMTETAFSIDDSQGATRYALGPVRAAQREAPGWVFGGGLAMSPTELAKWNIARITRSLLTPESWQKQETNVAPPDAGLRYGLGVYLDSVGPHRRVRHNGHLPGHQSVNRVYPDAHAAISVFINADFSNSHNAIADAIEALLLGTADDIDQACSIFHKLRVEGIDRSLFTDNGNFYFTEVALEDYRSSLSSLGELRQIRRHEPVIVYGGLTCASYLLTFADRTLLATVRTEPSTGRIEQFTVSTFAD